MRSQKQRFGGMLSPVMVIVLLMMFILSATSFKTSPQTIRTSNLSLRKNVHIPQCANLRKIIRHNQSLHMVKDNDNNSKKSDGIEPKYLAALGLFIFAALYDFFVTHNGQVYLAHP